MNFKNDISNFAHNVGIKIKAHSPEILILTGVGEMTAGAILACRASRKVDKIVEQFHAEMEQIEYLYKEVPDDPKAAAEQARREKKAIRSCYIRAVKELGKLYGLSIGLGVGGIVSILCGSGILKKRNAALAAAYTTLEGSYREYRRRVAEKYGEEAEQDIYYGTYTSTVEVTTVDENGNETTKTETEVISERPSCSPYARYFTMNDSIGAEANFWYNEQFLVGMQDVFIDTLKRRHYLYWNEVLGQLGYPEVDDGYEVGWVYDPDHPEGDNVVNLRIKVVTRQRPDGTTERIHMIDPNVDGLIREHMLKLKLLEKGGKNHLH